VSNVSSSGSKLFDSNDDVVAEPAVDDELAIPIPLDEEDAVSVPVHPPPRSNAPITRSNAACP
jgi:hypothetical protein